MRPSPCIPVFALLAVLFAGALCAEESKDEASITIPVPAAVKAALTKEAAGGRIIDLRREGDSEGATYEATIRIGKLEYSVIVEANGSLLRKELKEMQDLQRKIRLQELPEIARAVLSREASGGEIQSILEQKAMFTIVVEVKGQPYTLVIDADGTLLRKEPGEVSGADAPVSSPGNLRFIEPGRAVPAPPAR